MNYKSFLYAALGGGIVAGVFLLAIQYRRKKMAKERAAQIAEDNKKAEEIEAEKDETPGPDLVPADEMEALEEEKQSGGLKYEA